MKIGLAISTRNRREVALHSISQWERFLPTHCKLAIVDDASDVPYPGADFRFEQKAGIAVVKNKCLELLEDCDHIFLGDDDIYPLNEYWWASYVYSRLKHACYIYDRKILYTEPDYISYELPRGSFLYLQQECLLMTGGFDISFSNYGFEHAEWSRRVFNIGLTPAAYIDIPNSDGLFYSHDKEGTVRSSVPTPERIRYIETNRKKFNALINSKNFIPYK